MYKSTALCLALCAWAFACGAQVRKTTHQIIEIDSAQAIVLDLYGDKNKLLTWAGNNILVETRIVLYDCSEGLFNHFYEAGRYEIETETAGEELRLTSKDKIRKPIKFLERIAPAKDSLANKDSPPKDISVKGGPAKDGSAKRISIEDIPADRKWAECFEVYDVKLYLPDRFEPQAPNRWVRKPD